MENNEENQQTPYSTNDQTGNDNVVVQNLAEASMLSSSDEFKSDETIKDSDSDSDEDGYHFNPLDAELIIILDKRIKGETIDNDQIYEADIYKYHPQELTEEHPPVDDEAAAWYFFTPRDKKYLNGHRPNRSTSTATKVGGYWKATGKDKEIHNESGKLTGYRKALVFYSGKAREGIKTDWIMHEYRTHDLKESNNPDNNMELDKCILSKIYKKKESAKKKGAPGNPVSTSSGENLADDNQHEEKLVDANVNLQALTPVQVTNGEGSPNVDNVPGDSNNVNLHGSTPVQITNGEGSFNVCNVPRSSNSPPESGVSHQFNDMAVEHADVSINQHEITVENYGHGPLANPECLDVGRGYFSSYGEFLRYMDGSVGDVANGVCYQSMYSDLSDMPGISSNPNVQNPLAHGDPRNGAVPNNNLSGSLNGVYTRPLMGDLGDMFANSSDPYTQPDQFTHRDPRNVPGPGTNFHVVQTPQNGVPRLHQNSTYEHGSSSTYNPVAHAPQQNRVSSPSSQNRTYEHGSSSTYNPVAQAPQQNRVSHPSSQNRTYEHGSSSTYNPVAQAPQQNRVSSPSIMQGHYSRTVPGISGNSRVALHQPNRAHDPFMHRDHYNNVSRTGNNLRVAFHQPNGVYNPITHGDHYNNVSVTNNSLGGAPDQPNGAYNPIMRGDHNNNNVFGSTNPARGIQAWLSNGALRQYGFAQRDASTEVVPGAGSSYIPQSAMPNDQTMRRDSPQSMASHNNSQVGRHDQNDGDDYGDTQCFAGCLRGRCHHF